MNKYDLYITCKACREGRHSDCSAKQGCHDNYDLNAVTISCTCDYCKSDTKEVHR